MVNRRSLSDFTVIYSVKKTCINLNFDAGLLLLNGKQVMSRRRYPMAAAVVIVQMAQALAQAV